MSNWKPVWHQAVTEMILDGKPSGKNNTVVFSFHSPLGGKGLRIRFSNIYGKEDYWLKVTVFDGTDVYPLTFAKSADIVVPKGEKITSDELKMEILPQGRYEIRFFFSTNIIDCNMIEDQATLLKGDVTLEKEYHTVMRKPLLAGVLGMYNSIPSAEMIEICTDEETEAIVAFGDSITALNRWTKPLADRLEKEYGSRYVLLNSGIAGNCLLYDVEGFLGKVFGRRGTDRFADDVLNLPDVKSVIIALGVNDVSYLNEKTQDIITYDRFVKTIAEMTDTLHEKGIRVIMSTITPRNKVARTMGVYTPEMEELRLRLNDWIRKADIFDYVVDQDKAVRALDLKGYYFREGLHQGDHLHPNEEGGRIMAMNYDLKKLTGQA